MMRLAPGMSPLDGKTAIFVSWCLPLHHVWPCDPRKMEGFVEKAATALQRTFADVRPHALWVGSMEGGAVDSWFKRLASNLRGRALQLMPDAAVPLADAGEQPPEVPALFCMVGRYGLYAGLASPRECNGFYPGGVRFLPKSSDKAVSRAGAKAAEALYHARLFGEQLDVGGHWLELGASPGGMTWELLARGAQVTAVDRAVLDQRLSGAKGLSFIQGDVACFRPGEGQRFDALLCDMNGDPEEAFAQVLRLSAFLKPASWIIFTLKTAGSESFEEILSLHERVVDRAKNKGLRHVSTRHLSGNRREFTMWLRVPYHE